MSGARFEPGYDGVAIALHWLIALGVVALGVIGFSMTRLTLSTLQQFQLYQLHKSIGVTVLLAILLRILWRLSHRPPPLSAAIPEAERRVAKAAHIGLYAAMLLAPLTGWAVVSASPYNIPTVLFGVLPWPHLPFFTEIENKAPVEAALKLAHHLAVYALFALVAVHAAAALRHHFVLRDGVLARMLPALRNVEKSNS
ncbi:cytochrome B561 [Methylocella silvestris BL2]|uniref:Cytochrome B561 n=1 Tax=Methylocella silvestris (strain DSM 15510 / CIP 108128 / LMG 27833 / NCIMB 13906 / BL2) TaxID=395965 RepID=B8EMI1_METSB|nr:cytochrome b [Methylocella silvestris]ACK52109.1 cytochrome B561 [Methylocella silvestris BL2]